MNRDQKKYDLEERTALFGEEIIDFCLKLRQNAVSRPIITQIVRSATSIGANYMEANAASSKRDFRNKIYICKKETQETKHWLRMLGKCFPEKKSQLKKFLQEANELTLIFGKIISTLNRRTL